MLRILQIGMVLLPLFFGCQSRPTGSVTRASWGSPDPSFMITGQPLAPSPDAMPAGGADVSVFAVGPSRVMVGEPVRYGSGGYNYGPETATNVLVVATVTGGFDGAKWTAWPECTGKTQPGSFVLRCTLAQMTTVDKLPPITIEVIPTAAGKLTYDVAIGADQPDPNPGNNRASVLTEVGSIPTGADVAVAAYGASELMVGETGPLYFWVENRGPAVAAKAALNLAAKGAFEMTVEPPCVLTSPASAVCPLGDVPPYAGGELRAAITPLAAGPIAVEGVASSATADPEPTNNVARLSITAYQPVVADLALALADAPDPTPWKRPLTYTATVSNNGPDASGGAYLWAGISENVTLESVSTSQGKCAADPWGLYCTLGPLPAGAAATVVAKVVPQLGGTLTVRAEVYGEKRELDPDWSNNAAAETTTVHGGYPAVTSTDNLRFPTTMGAYIPCAGEYVLLEGDLHVLTHTTINRDHYQLVYAVNPQGLRGVGLASGAVFNGTGGTRQMERRSRSDLGGEFTYVNNYRMLSRGPYPNLTVHQVLHMTVHPDGHVTGYVDGERIECR